MEERIKIRVKIGGNTINPRVCVDVAPQHLVVGGRRITAQGKVREIIKNFEFVTRDAYGEIVVSEYNTKYGIRDRLKGLNDDYCINCRIDKIVEDVINKIKDEIHAVLNEVEEIEYCREFEI